MCPLHDKYGVVPTNVVFVFKLYYIDCLIKELSIGNSTWQPYITLTTLMEEEILEIIGLFCVLLEFQAKMKNWIHRHSTGFLNNTSVLTNTVILLGLLHDFPNY
jgi:hypothetical protein